MPGGRLGFEDRRRIAAGLAQGLSCAQIARVLGRPGSTVSREVARNGGPRRYRANLAQQASQWRARRREPHPAHPVPPDGPLDRREFQERFAQVMTETGLPPMTARVMACLYTVDADGIGAAALAERLGVSPASVSKSVSWLVDRGMVVRERDGRRQRYRIHEQSSYFAWRRSIEGIARWADLAAQGAALYGEGPAAERLRASEEFYRYLGRDMAQAAEHWRQILGVPEEERLPAGVRDDLGGDVGDGAVVGGHAADPCGGVRFEVGGGAGAALHVRVVGAADLAAAQPVCGGRVRGGEEDPDGRDGPAHRRGEHRGLGDGHGVAVDQAAAAEGGVVAPHGREVPRSDRGPVGVVRGRGVDLVEEVAFDVGVGDRALLEQRGDLPGDGALAGPGAAADEEQFGCCCHAAILAGPRRWLDRFMVEPPPKRRSPPMAVIVTLVLVGFALVVIVAVAGRGKSRGGSGSYTYSDTSGSTWSSDSGSGSSSDCGPGDSGGGGGDSGGGGGCD